jgi:hypothetical protein
MTKVNFGGLKQKRMASIVAISAIQVPKAFMNIAPPSTRPSLPGWSAFGISARPHHPDYLRPALPCVAFRSDELGEKTSIATVSGIRQNWRYFSIAPCSRFGICLAAHHLWRAHAYQNPF